MILYYAMMPEETFNDIIKNEKIELDNKSKIFNFYKQSSLLYMNKITSCIENLEDIDDTQVLFNVLSHLKIFLAKLHSLEDLLKKCNNNFNIIAFNNTDVNMQIKDYNTLANNLILSFGDFVESFEDFIKKVLEAIDFQFVNSTVLNDKSILKSNIINSTPVINNAEINVVTKSIQKPDNTDSKKSVTNSTDNLSDNNCLIISEKDNKVFLPYKINDLERILSTSSEYDSISEIIQKKYVLPLDKFKNPVLSRFKEAYHLMKEKEGSSFTEAFNLAIELSLISTLNPAIIAACKNKDELDIYLDCLEEKELEHFNLFEIKYEFNPTIK